MHLLVDIGNTHTHLGLADSERVTHHVDVSTADWTSATTSHVLEELTRGSDIHSFCFCSVVPDASKRITATLVERYPVEARELNARSVRGIGIDYPSPESIGADRLANALAARHHHGAPSVVIDFGTAVTFDVVNRHGNYVGGIIAPGMAVMTDYLHEKTALLPRIEIRDTRSVIGRSTEEAMLIGAVHGYRGLIRELIRNLKTELGAADQPVVATGGYAHLFDRQMDEITVVDELLTLEGLRLFAEHVGSP